MASIIESHEAKGDVPPYPDTKVTLAFGDDVFPVLVARLRGAAHDDVLLSGLQAAIRLLPTPLNGVKATEAKAVEAFVGLAEHGSPAVRRKAVQALEILLQTPQAKEVFVSGEYFIYRWHVVTSCVGTWGDSSSLSGCKASCCLRVPRVLCVTLV